MRGECFHSQVNQQIPPCFSATYPPLIRDNVIAPMLLGQARGEDIKAPPELCKDHVIRVTCGGRKKERRAALGILHTIQFAPISQNENPRARKGEKRGGKKTQTKGVGATYPVSKAFLRFGAF